VWFGRLTAAFMFGAALGGYLLGWVGDRWGRKRAIVLSITCYSLFGGLTYFAQSPEQLLVLRFIVGLGIGGTWPNGIALVSEAWPAVSRPLVAGIIGTAANVGLMLFATLACFVYVTSDNWRWTNLVVFWPILLAAYAAYALPESQSWLKAVESAGINGEMSNSHELRAAGRWTMGEIFRPPILRITILGILLGTIPQFGGWGSSNWANAWASAVGEKPQKVDPALKARTLLARSTPSAIASLVGGVVATWLGRRLSYSLVSIGCLTCSLCMFRFSHPNNADFLWWTAALGLFNGVFFGWLPLCLPELFPTRVRATGAGVSFNFGRVTTAIGILVVAELIKQRFGGDYAAIGQFTSWIYLIGAIVIWFAPLQAEKVSHTAPPA
jgi:MFS transporter, SHS family, sialic acid transporter